MQIIQGDFFDLIKKVPSSSVDCVITDPPYACTDLEWDRKLDLEKMFTELERVTTENAILCIFSNFRMANELFCLRPRLFRYEIIVHKSRPTGFFYAKYRPLTAHEYICVFCRHLKSGTYNPQKTPGKPYFSNGTQATCPHYKTKTHTRASNPTGERYPRSVLEIPSIGRPEHATQKPLSLLEWLVKTYSNPGDLVLDPFAGSGTTGQACLRHGRRFLGFDLFQGTF